MKIQVSSHQGPRSNNEDFFYIGDDFVIIADGLGGHPGGEVASRMACENLVKELELVKSDYNKSQSLGDHEIINAFQNVHYSLHKHTEQHHNLWGMGTTLTFIWFFSKDEAVIGHIGDTRVYLHDVENAQLIQLTEDHGFKNRLDKVVGGYELKFHIPSILYIDYKQTDHFVLTTDGIHDHVDTEVFETIINSDVQDISLELVNAGVLAKKDNCTAIFIESGN